MLPTTFDSATQATTLAERLRSKRKQKGWTQKQLAEMTGSNQAAIQKIENGKSLRPRNVLKLAEALQVSPAWLQFGDVQLDEELDDETLEMADAWSKLPEPHRSSIKQAVLRMALRRSVELESEVEELEEAW